MRTGSPTRAPRFISARSGPARPTRTAARSSTSPSDDLRAVRGGARVIRSVAPLPLALLFAAASDAPSTTAAAPDAPERRARPDRGDPRSRRRRQPTSIYRRVTGAPGDLDLCVAFGAPGAPLAFDARLFAVPDGALEPRDSDGGQPVTAEQSARCPETAHELLGPARMAGVVVHVPEGVFWRAVAPGRMAVLRLRSLLAPARRGRALGARGRGAPRLCARDAAHARYGAGQLVGRLGSRDRGVGAPLRPRRRSVAARGDNRPSHQLAATALLPASDRARARGPPRER